MRRARTGAVLVAAVLLSALAAAPAAAHNALQGTSPTAGARLAQTPGEIVLTFNEAAIAMGTRVIVLGPAGPVQTGTPRLVDNTVTQPLVGGAPAGDYTVEWRVTSADGHPISGTFGFSSAAAGSGRPPAAAPEPDAETAGGSTGIWTTVAVVVGLAVLGAALALRLARQRRRRPTRAGQSNPALPLAAKQSKTSKENRS